MKKILTIGGATQDIFLHINDLHTLNLKRTPHESRFFLFESGEKIEVEKVSHCTGGGATNCAVAFKRLGIDALCFSIIGYDAGGRHILDELSYENVGLEFIVKDAHESTGTSYIISAPSHEQTLFVHRGVNKYLPLHIITSQILDDIGYVYITSLGNTTTESLVPFLQEAKKRNILVALNPGLSQITKTTLILKECLPYIDVFILNTSEAKAFMLSLIESDPKFKTIFTVKDQSTLCPSGSPLSQARLLLYPLVSDQDFFSSITFFKEILSMGPNIVVITDGKNGVYMATEKEILFHPSLPTSMVDTVGAGDSFGASFFASIIKKFSLKDALRNGIINSSSVISKQGAKQGLLTSTEIENRRKLLDESLLQTFDWNSFTLSSP